MKRVACLSTIQSLSNDTSSSFNVIDIFNSTRAYNLEHQITGSFIVNNDYVLMIVEGESTHLGNIIFKTRQDNRLMDFSMIMNVEIAEPEFTSWGIKLLKQGNEGQERIYEKLNNIFKDDFKAKNAIDKKRLQCFLDAASKLKTNQTKVKPIESSTSLKAESSSRPAQVKDFQYQNSMISLTGWPKPGKIKLTPELIKICARLVGRPHRFEDLLQEKLVASEAALVARLNELHGLGIMRKHRVDEKPTLVGIKGGLSNKPRVSSTDRFSTVLKNFLSASKH
ncbi:hypothetical protein TDB9533_04564 [Thalassocella blandensis]|nr:hypothetical protein TDB9533_04564 [Thalassocella blandensis]